jgi:hypothetical protein
MKEVNPLTPETHKIKEISPLTLEEVQTLQTDSALRKIGELDGVLVEINRLLAEKFEKYQKAKIELEIAKTKKDIIIERARNLKAFVKGAQINL